MSVCTCVRGGGGRGAGVAKMCAQYAKWTSEHRTAGHIILALNEPSDPELMVINFDDVVIAVSITTVKKFLPGGIKDLIEINKDKKTPYTHTKYTM